jgi:hypothetical protein
MQKMKNMQDDCNIFEQKNSWKPFPHNLTWQMHKRGWLRLTWKNPLWDLINMQNMF